MDLEEFIIRKGIADDQKTVGIFEVVHREDSRQLFAGIGRLYSVAIDYWQLYKLVKESDNWSIEWSRLKETNPMEFATSAWTTYSEVSSLYAQEEYVAAGQAISNGLFPKAAA